MTREIPDGVDALVRRILGDVDLLERTSEGVSTQVCRIRRGDETLYLRLAEQDGLDMAPEVEAHERLRALGVRVAEIVHYEPLAREVGRSIAVTSEVPGASLIGYDDEATSRSVARAAGRDLAQLNGIDVEGWGWVLRDGRPGIRGAHGAWTSWLDDVVAAGARDDLVTALGEPSVAILDQILAEEARRSPRRAALAHGDFDVSQIFVADGAYSGIIDLGEIQGAEPHYDLAHFLVHDTEQNRHALLPDVIAGYREVAGIAADEDRLVRTGALLAVFRHTRVLARWGEAALTHPYVSWMNGRIHELLARSIGVGNP